MYYFQIKDDKLLEVGYESSGILLDYNPDPVVEIYPCYYNSYYKSDYTATYLNFSTLGARKGYKEIKADGYGTIILPTGTYANVVCHIAEVRISTEVKREMKISKYTLKEIYLTVKQNENRKKLYLSSIFLQTKLSVCV